MSEFMSQSEVDEEFRSMVESDFMEDLHPMYGKLKDLGYTREEILEMLGFRVEGSNEV